VLDPTLVPDEVTNEAVIIRSVEQAPAHPGALLQ
jgi:hypothetical protein